MTPHAGSGVLDTCLAALRSGGRLVVHGVTLETAQLLVRAFGEYGGEQLLPGVASPV